MNCKHYFAARPHSDVYEKSHENAAERLMVLIIRELSLRMCGNYQ